VGDSPDVPIAELAQAGLCAVCRHSQQVVSAKGSVFRLCRRALTEPRYRKYPPLPVVSCVGHEPGKPE
jgi:hypothetical protein